jgi:hypothetical protein
MRWESWAVEDLQKFAFLAAKKSFGKTMSDHYSTRWLTFL